MKKWKIRLCQEIRTQYQTHDDPNTGSHLVVLWRIPDCIRNRRWGGLSTRIAGLGHPHHRNISVMYIVQNLFHRGKHHRTIGLNAHYMVVFKNPRDVS
jgi:hypothetical protein